MTPNPGRCPDEARGKRVRVQLLNGMTPESPAGAPPGWAADGQGACSWARDGHPFSIATFEVIR